MRILLVHTPFDWRHPLTTLPHLIRKVCGTFWNHAAFHDEKSMGSMILESEMYGVKDKAIKKWGRDQTLDVWEVPLNIIQKIKVRAYSFINLKMKYSYADLFLWMPLYLAFGVYWGRTEEDGRNRPTCYEYLARVLEFPNWYRMTPNEFEAELIKRGYKKLYSRIHIKDYIKTL